MCGRYTLATPEEALVEVFDVPPFGFELPASWNVAPGQSALVVAEDARGRRAGRLTWGLVPAWAREPARPFINARAETVGTKPAFRDAFARRRCLVPADGFYEWKREAGAKIPHWFHPTAPSSLLAFAGVWESWQAPGAGEPRHAFSILTTEASDDVRPVHDRMPVIVPPDAFGLWLDRATPAAALRELLTPAPVGTLSVHPVSTRVNRTAENDAGLVEAVG